MQFEKCDQEAHVRSYDSEIRSLIKFAMAQQAPVNERIIVMEFRFDKDAKTLTAESPRMIEALHAKARIEHYCECFHDLLAEPVIAPEYVQTVIQAYQTEVKEFVKGLKHYGPGSTWNLCRMLELEKELRAEFGIELPSDSTPSEPSPTIPPSTSRDIVLYVPAPTKPEDPSWFDEFKDKALKWMYHQGILNPPRA